IGDKLVGHLFATWSYEQGTIRLCFRRRGIASVLMRLLRTGEGVAKAFGIVSSHPAGCLQTKISLDLSFIRDNAQCVLASSPIDYLKTAVFVSSLFDNSESIPSGTISSVLCGLRRASSGCENDRREINTKWPTGEFFVIVSGAT
ncbi:hypothetical protein C8F04DRAFT_977419, partial [Mycena alexandri]